MAELTVKSSTNINNLVVIPTAGTGSRLGKYTQNLNKSLLPYRGKPILSHIIEQFDSDCKFIIPVGYLSKQVKDYCHLVYPNLKIEFVDIHDWNLPTGGTGSTLRQCRDFIDRPFWYVPCDTYFEQSLPRLNRDCYFVSKVDQGLHSEYTTFAVENNQIVDISFKQATPENYLAFTGLMYINDHRLFFDRLTLHSGNEFIDILDNHAVIESLYSWIDMGNLEIYNRVRLVDQDYDFSKSEEITYIVNSKVVKWFHNENIPNLKFQRYQFNSKVFPDNCQVLGQFLAYDFFDGTVVYNNHSSDKFIKLLNWLKQDVWVLDTKDITAEFTDFYKTKTLSRIDQFLKKYPNLPKYNSINGVPVRNYQYYLKRIDWDYLVKSIQPAFIHGDLHFDNLVIDNDDTFKIIDWRYSFGNEVLIGDLYYDIAKLLGGLIINYSQIKKNNFCVEFIVDKVNLRIPSVDNITYYQSILQAFIYENNLDYRKVLALVPIIFWNMAPLHQKPFDLFLWYLGIYYFEISKFQQ